MNQALPDDGDRERAELADLIDRQLSPAGLAALDALAPRTGSTVLDIGCGAGQTLAQLAERVGPQGQAIGVDIAPRVLDVARGRLAHLPQVSVLQADATTLCLPDGRLDGLYSRFGVMAFADPPAAFGNLRRMVRAGGRLAFVCWRALAENELDALPLRAARLDIAADPLPFRFERAEAIEALLRTTGFESISVARYDAPVSCGSVEETLSVITHVGALGKILRSHPHLRTKAVERVRAALPPADAQGHVQLRAACWIVTATAG